MEDRKFGYIRVSSKSQEQNSSLKFQKQELISQGICEKNIRVEIGSASNLMEDRQIFSNLIRNELRENDLVMVTKIDRCSRNTLEFLKLQEELFQRSITFVALDIPHSADLAVNKFITTTICALATFENERRMDRQREGIKVAKAAGKYRGRKSVITTKIINEVSDLKENKRLSVTKIARLTALSRGTIYKILKTKLGYIPNKLVKEDLNKSCSD